MAFYLRVPSCDTSLSTVEECAVKRLEFLLQISECHGDYISMKDLIDDPLTVESVGIFVMEGSKNDRIGHFFLR